MSLLIPSKRDYEDAHCAFPSMENSYQRCLEQTRHKEPENFRWCFETVPGFFVQADPDTDDLQFRYTEQKMGRKMSWADIMAQVAGLNANLPPNVAYKVVVCARHGQGFHNQIVDKYGSAAWEAKWHALSTDGEITYGPDPPLTELGQKQAAENHRTWKSEIFEHGAPLPAQFYASPLQRSCWTHKITWEGLQPADKKTVVVETLRETMDRSPCDKRSAKSVIEERFAQYGFESEPGFSENDLLFSGDKGETDTEHAMRINLFCQWLFDRDVDASGAVDPQKRAENAFVCTTTHAGSIRLFILVFGHRRFTISTGGMIPIVVRGTREG